MRIKPEQIARIAHEANRAYCASIGDASQVAWDRAPEDIRESVMVGVAAHFKDENLTVVQTHGEWMDFRRKQGWKHGPVKDARRKTHPNMVPFGQLPPEQQVKDYLFCAVVKTLVSLDKAMFMCDLADEERKAKEAEGPAPVAKPLLKPSAADIEKFTKPPLRLTGGDPWRKPRQG